MAKKNQKRKIFGLVSEETGERLYYSPNRTDGEPIRVRKYNSSTRKHEWFVQTKKNLGRNEVKKRK